MTIVSRIETAIAASAGTAGTAVRPGALPLQEVTRKFQHTPPRASAVDPQAVDNFIASRPYSAATRTSTD